MHSCGEFTFDRCFACWAKLHLCINMFNDFFKNNVNLGSSFVMRTGNVSQVFCADITGTDGRDSNLLVNSGIFSQGIVFIFALTVTSLMVQRGLIFFGLRRGYAGILVVFFGGFSRKMDSISSTIMNRLIMSALLSAVMFPSAQSCSKSVFNRLTSALTEVLSKLAIKVNRIYLEYPYHIIAFFDLLETP
jgi:hypothetical protein